MREGDPFARAIVPESNRLDGAWLRKRVLAFACHIKYALPTMKLQFGCPYYFI